MAMSLRFHEDIVHSRPYFKLPIDFCGLQNSLLWPDLHTQSEKGCLKWTGQCYAGDLNPRTSLHIAGHAGSIE